MRDDEFRAMFDLEDRLWWYAGMRRITEAVLESAPRSYRNARLLDVGCGTGYSTRWLSLRLQCADCFGVDSSPRAAELWNQQRLDNTSAASAISLPFVSNQFDLVTCFDVVYQLEREGSTAALAEMFRVLKPGGLLLIREPAYDWLRGSHDSAVGTRHRFTLREMQTALQSRGFAIIRATYANAILFPAAVFHRLISRFGKRDESDVRPVGGALNRLLESALNLEAGLLRFMTFPFGLSVVVLAEKR
jgi:SAM-dependent methyltransferase